MTFWWPITPSSGDRAALHSSAPHPQGAACQATRAGDERAQRGRQMLEVTHSQRRQDGTGSGGSAVVHSGGTNGRPDVGGDARGRGCVAH